jgi:hypothetical protein
MDQDSGKTAGHGELAVEPTIHSFAGVRPGFRFLDRNGRHNAFGKRAIFFWGGWRRIRRRWRGRCLPWQLGFLSGASILGPPWPPKTAPPQSAAALTCAGSLTGSLPNWLSNWPLGRRFSGQKDGWAKNAWYHLRLHLRLYSRLRGFEALRPSDQSRSKRSCISFSRLLGLSIRLIRAIRGCQNSAGFV